MEAKVVDILSVSFERARLICVDRFDLNKWLAMALASWLAWLGSSGANANFNLPSGSSGDDGSLELPEIPAEGYAWLAEWATVIVGVGTAAFAAFVGLWLLLTWLRSRGQLMFIDLVTRDSSEVSRSWSEQGPLANDLFRTRLFIDLIGAAVLLLPTAAAIAFVLITQPSRIEPLLGPAIVLGIVLGLGGIAWAAVTFVLDEMIVPVAYAWQVPIAEAYAEIRRMASDTPGAFFTYLIVRFFAAVVVSFLSGVLSCLMCAISWLPFVSAVILLPFRVYLQSLPLAFLYQLNPDAYSAFAPLPLDG